MNTLKMSTIMKSLNADTKKKKAIQSRRLRGTGPSSQTERS